MSVSYEVQLSSIGNGKAGSLYASHTSIGLQVMGNEMKGDIIRQDMLASESVLELTTTETVSDVEELTDVDELIHLPPPMQLQLEIKLLPLLAVVDQMGQLEHNWPVSTGILTTL